MIDLAKIHQQTVEIVVNWLGYEFVLYARVPSPDERLQYRTDLLRCIKPDGSMKMKCLQAITKKWAKKVLTGFRKGDFVINGQELDPDDPEWVDKVWEYAPDIISTAVSNVFGNVTAETESPFLESVS